MCVTKNRLNKNCIPVGCIPRACWPYLPACTAQGDLLARGGLLDGGGLPCRGRGVVCLATGGICCQGRGWYPSMHWGRPPREQNHKRLWKYYLAPPSLRAVKIASNDCPFGCPIIYTGMNSQCYFVYRHLNNARPTNAHSLMWTSALAIIASNDLWKK